MVVFLGNIWFYSQCVHVETVGLTRGCASVRAYDLSPDCVDIVRPDVTAKPQQGVRSGATT
jgi:hypothetical protein